MGRLEYVKHEPISLKDHPEFNEGWLKKRIIDDPSILKLGDLEVKDVERRQPRAGRLDLLLHDPDDGKRYEVEIQLGPTDESHIIRCLEYWDLERKRYPQYDHCAVLVAEDITARFLNVVSLFNGTIPLIAVKLSALVVGDQVVLDFVKVLDEVTRGEDDDDDALPPPADRAYWEEKASPTTLSLVDDLLEVLRETVPSAAAKYNRYYIGITENEQTNNSVIFRPRKEHIRLGAKVGDIESWAERLEAEGMRIYGGRSEGRLTIRLFPKDLPQHSDSLRELFRTVYKADED